METIEIKSLVAGQDFQFHQDGPSYKFKELGKGVRWYFYRADNSTAVRCSVRIAPVFINENN